MKITIEIPDFEIYGNNDDTSTTFVSEIRNHLKSEVVRQIMAKSNEAIKDVNHFCKKEIDAIQSLTLNKIEIIVNDFQKQCDDHIKSLRDK